jgi:hypothetical protein
MTISEGAFAHAGQEVFTLTKPDVEISATMGKISLRKSLQTRFRH